MNIKSNKQVFTWKSAKNVSIWVSCTPCVYASHWRRIETSNRSQYCITSDHRYEFPVEFTIQTSPLRIHWMHWIIDMYRIVSIIVSIFNRKRWSITESRWHECSRKQSCVFKKIFRNDLCMFSSPHRINEIIHSIVYNSLVGSV